MSDDILSTHLRGERAIAVARHWISKNVNKTISSRDVAEFLKRRRSRSRRTRSTGALARR
jgi:hypothetical protein